MKKIGLTLTLAAILAVGSTQTLANGGIVISGVTETQTQCEGKGGIVISGVTENSCEEEENIFRQVWNDFTGIVISGFGIVISG